MSTQAHQSEDSSQPRPTTTQSLSSGQERAPDILPFDPKETISIQAGIDTMEIPKVAAHKIDYTLTEENADSVIAKLEMLRDNLQAGQPDKRVECHYHVEASSLSLALRASAIMKDIHHALKEHPNSTTKLEHPKEVSLMNGNSLTGREELQSILHYLQDPATPKTIRPQIKIKADSPQSVAESAYLISQLKGVLKNYPESQIVLKAPGGLPKETVREMSRQYRLALSYKAGHYNMRSGHLAEDLKNVEQLLEDASLDPDKTLSVKLPADMKMPQEHAHILSGYFRRFEKLFGQTLELLSPLQMLRHKESPYRSAFVKKQQLLQIGGHTLSEEEEDALIMRLREIKEGLHDRADNPDARDSSQYLLRIHSEGRLSTELLREINALRRADWKLQKKEGLSIDAFLFESERYIPGDFELDLKEGAVVLKDASIAFFRGLNHIRSQVFWLGYGLYERTRDKAIKTTGDIISLVRNRQTENRSKM